MQQKTPPLKSLIIAGFITAIMVMGIANLSFTTQQKSSVLVNDQSSPVCVTSLCSLL